MATIHGSFRGREGSAPSFVSRAGVAKLAEIDVDRLRVMYDAGELPPVDAWHVDMNFARPLWLMETIENWIRERWQKEPPASSAPSEPTGRMLLRAESWPKVPSPEELAELNIEVAGELLAEEAEALANGRRPGEAPFEPSVPEED